VQRLRKMLPVVVVVLAACSQSPAPPATVVTFKPGAPTPARDILVSLQEAVKGLENSGALQVNALIDDFTGRVEVTTTIDPGTNSSTSTEVRDVPADAASKLTTDQVLIGTTAYVRTSQTGEAPHEYAKVPLSAPEADVWRAGSYTLKGRLFDSLSVLGGLVGEVAFSAESLGNHTYAGDLLVGYRVALQPSDVLAYLVAKWAVVADSPHLEADLAPTVFELWIDSAGVLRRVVATGTQFEDGEALLDSRFEISYKPLKSAVIKAPTGP
jgi:hypothetical protein